ncbi:MAG: hypothetical protein K2N61_03535 [Lachnospiraceae bacterium]|nr:hypothetical protein [Lachnospiraceae bacterium]
MDAFFSSLKIWTFENLINYTREEWLVYLDDSSLLGEAGYNAHIGHLNIIFDYDSIDGLLRCDRLSRIYSERVMEKTGDQE